MCGVCVEVYINNYKHQLVIATWLPHLSLSLVSKSRSCVPSTYQNTLMLSREIDPPLAQPHYTRRYMPYPASCQREPITRISHTDTSTQVMGFQERLLFNIFLRKGILSRCPSLIPSSPSWPVRISLRPTHESRGNLKATPSHLSTRCISRDSAACNFHFPPPPPYSRYNPPRRPPPSSAPRL